MRIQTATETLTRLGKHLILSSWGIVYLASIFSLKLLRKRQLAARGAGDRSKKGPRGNRVPSWSKLSVLVVMVALILVGCNRDPLVRRQRYYDSGMEYYNSGKISEAAIQFRNALKVDPKYAEAATMLAKVNLQSGDMTNVYQLLLTAVEADPEYLPARLSLGSLYLAANRAKEAREQAEYVLGRAPENIDALVLLGSSQALEQDFQGAEETLNRALQINPKHIGTLSSLAAIKLATQEPAAAEELLRQMIANAPESPDGYVRLANFFLMTGRAPEAEPLLQKAVAVSKDGADILQLQARYYIDQQDWDQAEKVVRKIQSLHGAEEKYWMALADYFILRNEWNLAKVELEKALKAHQEEVSIQRKLVEVHLALNDMKGAEELNEAILKENPKDALAHLAKGRMFLAKGDFSNALLELNQTKSFQPGLPALYFWYAQVYSQNGDLEQAKQSLADALKYDPNFWAARLNLAELQNRTGAPDAALSNIRDLIARNPRDLRPYLLMTQAHMVKKDFPEAEKILKAIVEQVPENPHGHWQLGLLRLQQGNFAAARQQLEQAWNLQPESEAILQATVVSYILQKQPQRAITFLEEQSSSHPTEAMIHHTLGEVYRLQEKWDQAALNYEKALAKNPDAVGSAVALANLYVEAGKTNDAIRLLVNTAKRKPQDIGLAVATAYTLERSQRWQEAQKAYERVLELDSNNALAMNNLAWVLTENGGNIDVALGLAQKAKERQPDNVFVTDTIGWIYYKKNSYQTALQYLREAAEKQPQKALYQYHLGMAYLKTDRKQEARKALERALQLDPKFAQAESARQALAQL